SPMPRRPHRIRSLGLLDRRDNYLDMLRAIESTTNAKAIDDARQQYHSPLTIFFAHPGESRMDMFSRVLFDVDEHHQCGTFDVYGASERDIDPAAVTELNIHRVRETDYGFQLIR
ncbi:hypothetical protein, partial [Paracidovorax citrulli]|uniref:hypothetical protein n=3 Tax=Paracidovorax citrulli TaxID=80869 RepID=UPI001F25AD89